MSTQPAGKEQWATKIGVILAVSGSAVGLGNFLRFPGQATAYGGGAFMIPYFISLLILGIPICWVEWTLGRQGGRAGFHSSPGILHHLLRSRVGHLFGTVGLLIPVAIYMYYVYIEAWCLGYACDYLFGDLSETKDFSGYFAQFVGADADGLGQTAVYYLMGVFILNFILIYRGLTKGIEAFCKVAMPLLIGAAVIVLIRVLTLPPQPAPEPWQLSLADAMPAAQWSAVTEKCAKLQAADDADGLAKAVAEATETCRQATRDGTSGYDSDVRVETPSGYLATPDAMKLAAAIAGDPDLAPRYAKWIRQTRVALDNDTKWELIRLESAESGLAADLAGDNARKRGTAQEKLVRYRRLRAELLGTAPAPPPEVSSAEPHTAERFAAAGVAAVDRTVVNGLGFMWNPKPTEPGQSAFAALGDPQVWLAAAGQIFFSISVGFGIIITYASYLRRNDDVALAGLTATSTNEFCEVCLGGLITVPAAFIFLGATPLVGTPSAMGLGFTTLPQVFQAMPAGRFFGFLWFAMLFAAAITSSLSMLQPAIAFLEEGFGLKRKGSVMILGLITAVGCLLVAYFSKDLTALDTMDFWIGTFCVYVMATVLVIVFGWIVGVDKGLGLADEGAELRIPRFFGFVIKYVSPVYLLTIFGFWLYASAPDGVRAVMDNNVKLVTVIFLLIVGVFFGGLVSLAVKRWDRDASAAGGVLVEPAATGDDR